MATTHHGGTTAATHHLAFRIPIDADQALCHLLGAALRCDSDGTMRLRKSSFARILNAAPSLISYRLDYSTGNHYPTFDCGYGPMRIVLSEDTGRYQEAA